MATLRELASRLWGTLGRRRGDRDLEAELQSHSSWPRRMPPPRRIPERAMRAARLRDGHLTQAMESMRDRARPVGRGSCPRPPLRLSHARQKSWLHVRSRAVARDRHWRQQRGIQLCGCAPAPAASCPASGRAADGRFDRRGRGFSELVASCPEYVDIRDRARPSTAWSRSPGRPSASPPRRRPRRNFESGCS